jgi:hypothetical protein
VDGNHGSGKDFRPRRAAANDRIGKNRKPRPGHKSRKAPILVRFKIVYLSAVGLALIFIIVFAFLIKGRISQILGTNETGDRPDYEIFPYHSLPTGAPGEEENEAEDKDNEEGGDALPEDEFEDIGDLPPVPRVPAPPPQAPGNVTLETTATEPVTENETSITMLTVDETSSTTTVQISETEQSTEAPSATAESSTETTTSDTVTPTSSAEEDQG